MQRAKPGLRVRPFYRTSKKANKMATVTVNQTFVGQPDEMEKYGGQIPADLKKSEKKMSAGEKANFSGKIHAGTKMEVSEERAKELLKLGLIEGDQPKEEKAPREKASVMTTDNVKEKKTDVQPTAKAKKK